jgi:hypothetical protein
MRFSYIVGLWVETQVNRLIAKGEMYIFYRKKQ